MYSIILLVCSIGLIVLPPALFNRYISIQILRNWSDSPRFQLFLIGLTILFGAALLFYAKNSSFPVLWYLRCVVGATFIGFLLYAVI